MKRFFASLVLALGLPAVASFPEKPIRIVIGVPAGGASDAAARAIGQALSRSLGQPVIVENKPGAGGALAAQAVYSATPDGHTLLWAQSSMAGLPMLQRATPFKSLGEFAPISIVCRLPAGVFVHPSVPVASVAQLVSHARANPDRLNFATGPLSEYMAAAEFMRQTNTAMVRVPYKGGAPALIDFVEGRVQVYFTPLAQALPHARAGKVRMLATMMPTRSEHAPDVPTLQELGLEIAVPNWNALVAPPKTPQAVVERLSREIRHALDEVEMRNTFAAQYLVAESSTPAELAAAIAESHRAWTRFVAENAIPQE